MLNTILDVINTAYKDISDSDEYDINLDGKFDVQDVTYLQLGISGKDQFTDTQKEIADYNNDGKIDVQDVTKAQMIISEVTVPVKPNPTPDPEPDPEPEPEPEPEPTTSYNREFADRVIELVNIERAKEGLKPLKKMIHLTVFLIFVQKKQLLYLIINDLTVQNGQQFLRKTMYLTLMRLRILHQDIQHRRML